MLSTLTTSNQQSRTHGLLAPLLTMASKQEQSDYEAKRLATIAQNRALLLSLNLNTAAQALNETKRPARPRATPTSIHKRRAPRLEVSEFVPRRTSSRLAGLQADSEVAKRKAEDESFAFQQAAKSKWQRVSGELNLSDILVAGKMWDRKGDLVVDIEREKAPRYARTFTERDVADTGDRGLKGLRERMSGLELHGDFTPNQIKITPERIVSVVFHVGRQGCEDFLLTMRSSIRWGSIREPTSHSSSRGINWVIWVSSTRRKEHHEDR